MHRISAVSRTFWHSLSRCFPVGVILELCSTFFPLRNLWYPQRLHKRTTTQWRMWQNIQFPNADGQMLMTRIKNLIPPQTGLFHKKQPEKVPNPPYSDYVENHVQEPRFLFAAISVLNYSISLWICIRGHQLRDVRLHKCFWSQFASQPYWRDPKCPQRNQRVQFATILFEASCLWMCGQLKKKTKKHEMTQSHEHPVAGNWPQISLVLLQSFVSGSINCRFHSC